MDRNKLKRKELRFQINSIVENYCKQCVDKDCIQCPYFKDLRRYGQALDATYAKPKSSIEYTSKKERVGFNSITERYKQYSRIKQKHPELLEKDIAGMMGITPGALPGFKATWIQRGYKKIWTNWRQFK